MFQNFRISHRPRHKSVRGYLFFLPEFVMKLTSKLRRDWHYYAFAIGLIFILNGVVGLLGFEAKGWQTYAVGLVSWVISFWLAGMIIRRRPEETTADETETAKTPD
ncbi:YaiZ [Enterobacter ludwigii]|uniref:YaiZ n=2 Tax=Enterobacter ludwigii TaxID=299767 RepID=G8LP76_9ENTR|nr:YaiZ [Enterobacter ludwigii]